MKIHEHGGGVFCREHLSVGLRLALAWLILKIYEMLSLLSGIIRYLKYCCPPVFDFGLNNKISGRELLQIQDFRYQNDEWDNLLTSVGPVKKP